MPTKELKKIDVPEQKAKLVNAWMRANLKHRNQKTAEVARDIKDMISKSPYKDVVFVREVSGNVGVISVALPDERKVEVLDFLMTHRDIEKKTIGRNSYKQPRPHK